MIALCHRLWREFHVANGFKHLNCHCIEYAELILIPVNNMEAVVGII